MCFGWISATDWLNFALIQPMQTEIYSRPMHILSYSLSTPLWHSVFIIRRNFHFNEVNTSLLTEMIHDIAGKLAFSMRISCANTCQIMQTYRRLVILVVLILSVIRARTTVQILHKNTKTASTGYGFFSGNRFFAFVLNFQRWFSLHLTTHVKAYNYVRSLAISLIFRNWITDARCFAWWWHLAMPIAVVAAAVVVFSCAKLWSY